MPLNILPNAGQSLDETRDPIRDNFTYINNGFLVNHVELNTGANSGKHNAVTFPQLAADPTAISVPRNTVAGEVMLYAKADVNTTGGTGIFFMGPAGTNIFSITGALKATSGWTKLPSGILIQWGTAATVSGAGSAGTAIAFPIPFTTCYNVQLTAANNGSSTILMVLKTVTAANFTVYSRSGNDSAYTSSNFYFYAVGV